MTPRFQIWTLVPRDRLDPHPVAPPASTFVMVSCEETTQDLMMESVGHRRHTITVDYQAQFEVAFEFVI